MGAWCGSPRGAGGATAIGVGAAAGLLPWFYYAVKDGRTMFNFYVLPALPFLILAVVYVLGAVMTPPEGIATRTDRHLIGTVAAGAYVLAVALCFVYFYPLFVGQVMTYHQWIARLWLGPRWTY